MAQPKYRQSDGQIVNFKPSDDAVPINQEELRTSRPTYDDTPATTNPAKNVVSQKSLRTPDNSLKFPLDTSNPAYSGKIVFTLYEQQPYEFTEQSKQAISQFSDNVVSGESNTAAKTEDDTEKDPEKIAEEKKQLADDATVVAAGNIIAGDILQNLIKITRVEPGTQSGRNVTQAQLYFPLSITIDDDVQYEGASLTKGGMASLGALKAGTGLMGAFDATKNSALATLTDFFSGDMTSDAGRYAAMKYASKIKIPFTNIGIPQTAISIATGLEVNPNMRTLFRGVSIRAFSFTFKLIPRSEKEAEEIGEIIKFFRSELYPEIFYIGGGENGEGAKLPLGYKFPKLFKIAFKHRGSEAKIPQLEYCYLRGVSSTYNPTSSNFMKSGHPNEIDLTLRFQEHRALSREDVLGGM